MVAAIETVQRTGLHPHNAWVNLFFSVVLGAVVYLAMCAALAFRQTRTAIAKIRSFRSKSGIPNRSPDQT
jgi:hypothetical protein